MKKLLIFGYTMDMGGAEKALLDTIKYLSKKVSIDLYLLEAKGVLMKEIPDNVNVYEMKKNKFWYLFFRFIPIFRKRYINKIFQKGNYEYVFGYMEGRCATWVSDIDCDKVKKYAWIHNDVFKFDIGISDREIKKSYNNLDKIICVSGDAKENFCKKYGIDKEKVLIIYNYINEEEIIKKSSEFEVNNDVFTFVNVAKMRDQKRQDRLVEAGRILKNRGYKFKIQLVGDGPNLDKIKNMVYNDKLEDVIEILGLQTNPYPYIKNADCFVLTSDMEGYGIVIKEALLLGKRIITTDVVGPREILHNGEYGVIVPIELEKIVDAMEDMLVNPDNYSELDKRVASYKGDNDIIKKETFKLLDL